MPEELHDYQSYSSELAKQRKEILSEENIPDPVIWRDTLLQTIEKYQMTEKEMGTTVEDIKSEERRKSEQNYESKFGNTASADLTQEEEAQLDESYERYDSDKYLSAQEDFMMSRSYIADEEQYKYIEQVDNIEYMVEKLHEQHGTEFIDDISLKNDNLDQPKINVKFADQEHYQTLTDKEIPIPKVKEWDNKRDRYHFDESSNSLKVVKDTMKEYQATTKQLQSSLENVNDDDHFKHARQQLLGRPFSEFEKENFNDTDKELDKNRMLNDLNKFQEAFNNLSNDDMTNVNKSNEVIREVQNQMSDKGYDYFTVDVQPYNQNPRATAWDNDMNVEVSLNYEDIHNLKMKKEVFNDFKNDVMNNTIKTSDNLKQHDPNYQKEYTKLTSDFKNRANEKSKEQEKNNQPKKDTKEKEFER